MTSRMERVGATLELVMDVLEMLVFAALATAVVIGVVMLLGQTVKFAILVAHPLPVTSVHAGHEDSVAPMEAGYSQAKGVLLALLDTALILVIGLDILRTLVVAVVHRELHLFAALEAGILAMIREIIGAEVRHKNVYDLLGYAVIIVMLAGVWLLARREMQGGMVLHAKPAGERG